MSKKRKSAIKPAITHEWYRVKSSPTPCDRLNVCDKCRESHWGMHTNLNAGVHLCPRCNGRMREGTPEEYEAALKSIKHHI